MNSKPNYAKHFALVTIIFQLIKAQKKCSNTNVPIWFNSITYQSPDQLLFFSLISLMTNQSKMEKIAPLA